MTQSDNSEHGPHSRIASCACGGLKVVVTGEPAGVYACACLDCQRATGTAFAYRARFPRNADTRIAGDRRVWRRVGDAGRWVEQSFCPTCGTIVFVEGEALPGDIIISAGCFADPKFAAPTTMFRARRRHHWYDLDEGIRSVD